MSVRVGLSSWSYSWAVGVKDHLPERPMDSFALLAKAARLDVPVVQIADNLPLHDLPEAELIRLGQEASRLGIAIEVGTRGVRTERIAQYVRIAEILGAKLLRTLLHDETGCPTLEQAERDIRMSLPLLEEHGVTLGIENHDFFHTTQIASLVTRLDHPLAGVCLDPVNNMAQGESAPEVLAHLARHTVNFHCKDYTIRRKPTMLGFDVEGCPSGEGMLDLARCVWSLPADISWVVELWTPWQGSLDATIALEDDWATRSVAALKAL